MLPKKTIIVFWMMVLFVFFRYMSPPISPGVFHFYVDDLLAVPIIGTIILYLLRYFVDQEFVLPISHVLFITISLTVLFELILPMVSSRYTRDPLDIISYLAGSIFFYTMMNNGKSTLKT